MKPFDEEQAKAVWERVLAGRTPPAAPEPVEEKEAARAAMAEAVGREVREGRGVEA